MSFLEFLTHHYGGHQKDADWNTDMKLPFMQHSDTLHIVVVPPGTPVTFNKEVILVCSDTQLALYKDRAIPFAGQKGIWQPPKSC